MLITTVDVKLTREHRDICAPLLSVASALVLESQSNSICIHEREIRNKSYQYLSGTSSPN
jgi:hypothetical protein